jgi:hypothetical protein
MRRRTYTIAQGSGEWVVFDDLGARVTSFPYLAHAVACVVATLEGAFDRLGGGRP